MKKRQNHLSRLYRIRFFALMLSVILMFPVFSLTVNAAPNFVPRSNITAYGLSFYNNCENQQWFINEIERLLNVQKKTINNLSSGDLNEIYLLSLVNRKITGKIPKAIGELPNLKHLFLSGNQLTDYSINSAFPAEIFSLQNLETIDVSHNNYTGQIPSRLQELPKLKILLLWDNQFTGGIPSSLGQINTLVNLDISDNLLSGTIPAALGDLDSLRLLSASNNQLTGSIPSELCGCSSLKALLLWNNQLSGSIPTSLSSLSDLWLLDLAQNNLSGSLPPTLPESLREFSVRENQLTGTIPASYENLTELTVFDVHQNSLSGNLPDFSAMLGMRTYDISDNGFTGTIPNDMFVSMAKLRIAWLQNNKLVGYAPASLLDHQINGASVNLSENYLTGIILSQIVLNEDNFTDNATTFQNRMYLDEEDTYFELLPRDTIINIYELFDTRDASDMQELTPKDKLRPEDYTVALGPNMVQGDIDALLAINHAQSIDEIIDIQYDANGIYVQAIGWIPRDMSVELVLRITHNDDSEYSQTTFVINTGDYEPPDTSAAALASLIVTGGARLVGPNFDPDVLEYTYVVGAVYNEITIIAIPVDANAIVTGDGKHNVEMIGPHVFPVVVTAPNGATRTYTVTVIQTGITFKFVIKSMMIKIGKPQIIPFDYDGLGPVAFSSSNPAICTVDSNGILNPIKQGTVTITITVPDQEYTSYLLPVTVTA